MAYSKQTWSDAPATSTPLSASRLAHMEDGIDAAVPKGTLLYNVRDYGAAGNGTGDDAAAIATALAAIPQLGTMGDAYDGTTARPRMATLYFPDGVYPVSAAIVLPQNVQVSIAQGATIKATASMTAVIDTGASVLHQDGLIDCAGTIDCNALASYGIYIRWFARYVIQNPRIYSPAAAGIVLGDPSATTISYEGHVVDPYVWRANNATVPTGSIGVWLRNVTDAFVGGTGSSVVGCKIGLRNDQGNNTVKSFHPWGYPAEDQNAFSTAFGMDVGFLDNTTGSVYIDCYSDSAMVYGFQFTADDPGAQMIGCRVYNAYGTTDNTAVAVQVDSSTTGSVTVLGLQVVAGSASYRYAADFAGNLAATVRLGTRCENVVSVLGDAVPGTVGVLPTVTTDTTLTATQPGCLLNATSQSSVELPDPTTVAPGKTLTVKVIQNGSDVCYVYPGSGFIDGRGALGLIAGDAIQLYSDGLQWRTISHTYGVAVTPPPLTSPAVSGTAYQNLAGRNVFISAAYTPTGSGTVTLALSADAVTYTTFDIRRYTTSGSILYITFMLPDQNYYKLTAVAATLGAVVQVG